MQQQGFYYNLLLDHAPFRSEADVVPSDGDYFVHCVRRGVFTSTPELDVHLQAYAAYNLYADAVLDKLREDVGGLAEQIVLQALGAGDDSEDEEEQVEAVRAGAEALLEDAPSEQADDSDSDADDTPCEHCGGRESTDEHLMLLCDRDGCDAGWHMACLPEPLDELPVGEWFCPDCTAAGARSAASQVFRLVCAQTVGLTVPTPNRLTSSLLSCMPPLLSARRPDVQPGASPRGSGQGGGGSGSGPPRSSSSAQAAQAAGRAAGARARLHRAAAPGPAGRRAPQRSDDGQRHRPG